MDSAPQFLEVPRLLETSMPRPRSAWVWYALIAFVLVVLSSAWSSSSSPQVQGMVRLAGGVAMLGLMVALGLIATRSARKQRSEQQRLEAIEELVQLRRWDQAAALLESMLLQPATVPAARLQALIYLSSVLARYQRYADSIAVLDYLLDHVEFDPRTRQAVKLMRTMSMLHEDHLVDADRAINDLRREAPDSGGLALIEMYRDVKTGHPAEAVEIFQARLPQMRAQLGQRIADAHALAAAAHEACGQDAEAAAQFEKATLLCSFGELLRRYPELSRIKDKFTPAPRPVEASLPPASNSKGVTP